MPALVLPEFPGTSEHRCVCSPLAGHEAVRVSAHQADSSSPVQGEGERCLSSTRSPVLAIPDMVLGADSSSISAPLGDSNQAGPALSASGQDLAPSDLAAVGMAHLGPQVLISSLPAFMKLSLMLTSLKRVGDLQTLSFSEMCMDFAPDLVKVILRPRPGYVSKVLSASFHSQVVPVHSFHPPPFASGEDVRLYMLCPVRALKIYVDRSSLWRHSKACMFWCWLPWAFHIEAHNFSLGEGCYFAGL